MRIGAFCALIPHIYYGVGYCVGYLQQGLSTTFIWINEVSSTLSLYKPIYPEELKAFYIK
jgi:hypothetical protein